jgi:2-dehydro-3-deoxyphosphogluconate aldolase/(4S)-4-hydroxy-2-oxoglutarate aldolase
MISFPDDLKKRIRRSGVIAVVTVPDASHAVELAKVLLESGIGAIELTLRTEAAVEAIGAVKAHIPEMLVGAGTVIRPDQVKAVKDAGADFAVSPGCNPVVLEAATKATLPFAPGISTASDIEHALMAGANILKYFPAETSGGLKHLKPLSAPFRHLGLQFIPLGGLREDTFMDYLQSDLCIAIGGSWIAPEGDIMAGDWDAIGSRAKRARERMQTYLS